MSTTNTFTVYTIAYNEEKIIPYFVRHYGQFVDKIAFDRIEELLNTHVRL